MRTYTVLSVFAFILATAYGEEKKYFTAAVFENAVLTDPESWENTLTMNLKLYSKAAAEAALRGADILVFPEFGLFPYRERSILHQYMEHVPDPKKNKLNPCEEALSFEDRPILLTLSCIARSFGLYVVANTVDTQPCDENSMSCDISNVESCQTTCPEDGRFMYNTNIAFDRKGNLIARYHKNNLYFEQLNTPANPEYATFKTEFGTFGMIICFDSVFIHSVNVVENYGVDHLLFPTHWFDDILPFNAIEWQQSWAFANGVNLIAANVHHPGLGTLGSGIFSKKYGALSYTYNPDGKSKLVVARVPLETEEAPDLPDSETDIIVITEDNAEEEEEIGENFPEQCFNPLVGAAQDNQTEYRCFKSQLAQYTLEKLENSKGKVLACNNGFCCTAAYSAPTLDEDYYLAAFKGTNDVRGFFKWEEESCFLVRCDPFEGKPCAVFPSKAKTVFEYVEMQATFTAERVYPTVSKAFHRLAPSYEWQLQKTGNRAVLKYESKAFEPLLKVGLLGRCYSRDPPFVPFRKAENQKIVSTLTTEENVLF